MRLIRLLGCAIAAALASTAAFAQVPTSSPPYNIDLGAVLTNTARGASTVNSSTLTNLDKHGVVCTYNQTAHGGSPSTTFGIQVFDAASNTWQSLATSGAITADATPTSVVVYPGAVATAVPTGMVLSGLPLTRSWRVTETVGGTATPTVTGTIGCNYIR
jgi:hypothetical protein